MKALLAAAIFFGPSGFSIWEHMKIQALQDETASLSVELSALRKPQPPANTLQRILCPLCKGEKRYAYGAAGQGKLHSLAMLCPVCVGVGYRDVKILPGFKLCPDCKGMGIVFSQNSSGQIPHNNCGRCGATGLVPDAK